MGIIRRGGFVYDREFLLRSDADSNAGAGEAVAPVVHFRGNCVGPKRRARAKPADLRSIAIHFAAGRRPRVGQGRVIGIHCPEVNHNRIARIRIHHGLIR